MLAIAHNYINIKKCKRGVVLRRLNSKTTYPIEMKLLLRGMHGLEGSIGYTLSCFVSGGLNSAGKIKANQTKMNEQNVGRLKAKPLVWKRNYVSSIFFV